MEHANFYIDCCDVILLIIHHFLCHDTFFIEKNQWLSTCSNKVKSEKEIYCLMNYIFFKLTAKICHYVDMKLKCILVTLASMSVLEVSK